MNKKQTARWKSLAPNNVPKWIHCYDNGGKTVDRYTVVFTGNNPRFKMRTFYLEMSEYPFHPQGFGQHGEAGQRIDYPRYGHIGKKIRFLMLPKDCQAMVLADYLYYWNLPCPKCGKFVDDPQFWGIRGYSDGRVAVRSECCTQEVFP